MPIYYAAVRPQDAGDLRRGVRRRHPDVVYLGPRPHRRPPYFAEGAKTGGTETHGDIDVTTLIACAVSDDRDEARDELRRYVASYVWRFPRYRRLVEEAGFADEVQAVAQAWREGRVGRRPESCPCWAGRYRRLGRLSRRVP